MLGPVLLRIVAAMAVFLIRGIGREQQHDVSY